MDQQFRRLTDKRVVSVSATVVGSNGVNYVRVNDGRCSYWMRESFLSREYALIDTAQGVGDAVRAKDHQ